ncbi:MAG: hydantoinase subunit beta [Alphaproteobacteria bacterium]|nr:MAG: hydantoinase subunit beta [Alphaproteobacteria bacterium]
MRLGIDVGGTNTDAVLMNGADVIAWSKSLTTSDVCSGIVAAIDSVLQKTKLTASVVECVMIGTTQFTNALVERKGLKQVGVIRLGSPSGQAIPAMSDWPDDLRACIGSGVYSFAGGYEFDGREMSILDEDGIRKAAQVLSTRGITAFAVTGVFSPVKMDMESRAVEILREEMPDAHITASNNVGRIGFLERESAAILNATLSDIAAEVIHSFEAALRTLNITAPLYISQNDGTLISAQEAVHFPVMTIGSGPTNSMRGAAFLTGISDAIVIDVGGTTSDVGVLTNGFPRESSVSVDIGGVRTNFRMPDTLAIGLGGGTQIYLSEEQFGALQVDGLQFDVGPKSVGYRLSEAAYIFGGTTLTATDIAVASGRVTMGNALFIPPLSQPVQDAILARFKTMLETAVDRMKTIAGDACVIVVGGGGFLVPDNLKGASRVLRPEYSHVANAVGAAIAQVGAQVEQVFSYDKISRDVALNQIKQQARDQVIALGGEAQSVQFTNVEEIFLSYLPGRAAQLRVKAVADLKGTRKNRTMDTVQPTPSQHHVA